MHLFFTILLITQDLKKIKNSQTTLIKLPINNKKIKLSGFVKETLEYDKTFNTLSPFCLLWNTKRLSKWSEVSCCLFKKQFV